MTQVVLASYLCATCQTNCDFAVRLGVYGSRLGEDQNYGHVDEPVA